MKPDDGRFTQQKLVGFLDHHNTVLCID